MKAATLLAGMTAAMLASAAFVHAQRRPAPPPSRYSYTFEIDKKSLPKGAKDRVVGKKGATRHFLSHAGDKPLVINEKFHLKRRIAGTKLVSGKVYQYFPNGVPMEGKTHLKGWQAPFGVIKETLLSLPKEPARIYAGRKPGLSKDLPPPEKYDIPATYDGKPHNIRVTIHYHLNPKYDAKK